MLVTKRLTICFAVLFFFAVHASALMLIGGRPTAVGGCDDCSGTLAYSHHAENNDDATQGTPCGCADGTASWVKTGLTYTVAEKYDGSYGVEFDAYGDRATINTDNGDLTETGSFEVWFKENSAVCYLFNLYIDDTHQIYGRYNSGTAKIELYWNDGGGLGSHVSTNTVTASTWTNVKFGWDFSQAGGSDETRVKVGDNAWEVVSTRTVVDIGDIGSASWKIGHGGYTSVGFADAIKFYTTKDCT